MLVFQFCHIFRKHLIPFQRNHIFFDQIYRQQHEIINLLAIWCPIRDVLIVCVICARKLNHFISIRINFSLKSRWRWQPQSQCWHIRQRMCECVFHLYFESPDIDTRVNAFNAFLYKKKKQQIVNNNHIFVVLAEYGDHFCWFFLKKYLPMTVVAHVMPQIIHNIRI